MDNEKDFREIDENGVELSDVKETEIHEEHPEDEYEDVCFIWPSSGEQGRKNDSSDTGDSYLRGVYAADHGYDE